MTDKEIIERAKQAEKRTGFGELVHSPISKGVNSAFGIGFIEGMVEYRNSMQEEPVTSVWHNANEMPEFGKRILTLPTGTMKPSCFTIFDEKEWKYLFNEQKWAYFDELIML